MYRLIIFGPPGVGKGTQAELISKKLNLKHVSTGEILRKAVNEGTELGKKAKEIMDRGDLVGDDIMCGIVRETLKEIADGGFILDGFPRTVEQAKALSDIFKELGMKDIQVINLTADEQEIIDRLLKRGRSDDTRETILNRLKVYFDSTAPVKEYYDSLKLVKNIKGVGQIESINADILKEIEMKK